MSAIEKLVSDDIKLPSPPAIAIRILEAVKKEDVTYEELARIISSDPSLVAKALKIVNSPIYGLPQKVDSLEKALAMLGLTALKNIALSFVIASELRTHSEGGFNFDFFWKRSVTAAVAADLTATLLGNRNENAFVTGLLQDIGIAILYFCKKEDYLRVLDERKAGDCSLVETEKRIFDFDHQELGSEILKKWGLPDTICMPVRYHHKNGKVPDIYKLEIDTIHLSDKISSVYHGSNGSEKVDMIYDILRNVYHKSEADTKNLIDSTAERSIEIFSVFEIDPRDMKPYSEILQEANEELGKLNLSYEHLIIRLKESKTHAENLATELKTANEKLKKLALQDSLTGLYNRRHFQTILDKEFSKAIRYQRPFSLIMFDLDHFKRINDSHGHRLGDKVLQEIGALFLKAVRTNDVVARYGGEEFAIIAPETDLKGAAVLAERIRKSIERMEIELNSAVIRTTVSAGAATCVPGENTVSKYELLDAADSALYAAKKNGRNCVAVAATGPEQS